MDFKIKLLLICAISAVLYYDVTATKEEECQQYQFKSCKLKGDKLMAMAGPKGEKGDMGVRGQTGMSGAKGARGIPGLNGPMGESIVGQPGRKGDEGLEGNPGSSGLQGLPGIEDCKKSFVDEERTVQTLCDSPGIIDMGPLYQQFQVNCTASGKACLLRGGKTQEIQYSSKLVNDPFWMSSVVNNILKTLYDTNHEQIRWLQERSSSVKQILRYHCLQSVHKSNITSSIQLLTWNDKLIGAEPTEKTPFSYSVPPDTDYCKDGGNLMKFSEIVLQSAQVHRLPIIDVLINDLSEETHTFYLESVEVCFE